MMEFEDMKAVWSDLNNRVAFLEEENRNLARKITHSNYKNIQEKLSNKYLFFIFLGIFCLIFIESLIIFNPITIEKYKLANIIYWGLFLTSEITIDIILFFRVKNINIYESTTEEIAMSALTNWKLHKLAVCIGLPLAIGAIILLALLMGMDQSVITGMAIGAVIGLTIGIFQLMKFSKYYKQLQIKS